MNGYDVLVVGGRVAGASTAMLLARAGARVALVERSRPGTDTLSTHGLMRGGVLQLTRWGLLDQVVRAGTPAVASTTFHHDDGQELRVSIKPGAGVRALYAPRRFLLDRVLQEAAAAAGADVLHRTTVTGLLGDADRVTGVEALDARGRRMVLPAALTVGADGIGSRVARDVDAPVTRAGANGGAVLYRYVAGLPADGYHWSYGGGAAAGLIPTNGGLTCVFVGTSPTGMQALRRAGTEAAFDSLLGLAAPRFADEVRAGDPVGRIHGWGGVPGHLREPAGPGWALVGDAGYFKDPITAHGITDALRDAELLADAVLAGRPGEPAPTYRAIRDRLSRQLFAVTEEVAGYAWDTPRIKSLLRQVSSAMSDEVDHLAGLPARPFGPVSRDIGPADTAELAG